MSVWVKCERCGSLDKMYYKSKLADKAAKYRQLQSEVNKSSFLELRRSTPNNESLCMTCLDELSVWIKDPNAHVLRAKV